LNAHYRRNHLRLQWIPYLKIFLNLNLFKKIDQFQRILNLENQYLQLFLQKVFLSPLYLNNHFFYFPKIFQYFILYHFYYFVNKKFLLMKFLVFFKNFIVKISKLKLAKAQFRFRKILAKDPVIGIF